jgi:hypothetical protein
MNHSSSSRSDTVGEEINLEGLRQRRGGIETEATRNESLLVPVTRKRQTVVAISSFMATFLTIGMSFAVRFKHCDINIYQA